MTTISGSPISSTAVLLSTLRDNILANTLGDSTNTYFSDAQVQAWINDAIKLYTFEIQTVATLAISTDAEEQSYDLPSRFAGIVSVEYPTGEYPPSYLTRLNSFTPDFWQTDGHFDIISRHNADAEDTLIISEAPAAAETITIVYKRFHDYNLTASSVVTVPEVDHPVLTKYVEWAATVLLQQQEQPDPTSNSSLLMSMYAQSAGQLKAQFDNLLARASQRIHRGQSAVISWLGSDSIHRSTY